MTVCLIRTAWSGTSGGPGVTQIAVREKSGTFITAATAQSAVNAMKAFWESTKNYLPDEVKLTVSPTVDGYDETTGVLVGSTSAPTPPAVTLGGSIAAFSMPSGMKIALNTATIRYGRRVRGAMFLVPSAGATMNAQGMVDATIRTNVQGYAQTLKTALDTANLEWVVYSRFDKNKPARPGSLALITGIEVNEKMAILRGRRD